MNIGHFNAQSRVGNIIVSVLTSIVSVTAMQEKIRNIHVGWDYFGVVEITKEWCVLCAKSRSHEVAEGNKVCLACCYVTEGGENGKV